jgi:copper oxidase (laccase) domain-containing protein
MPGLPVPPREGHTYFDGWACARAQLVRAGVPDTSVFTARLCTASHADELCSYRRHGASAGRLVGVVMAGGGSASRPSGAA